MSHETDLRAVRSRPTGRPDGWLAACTCGWTGDQHATPSEAVTDVARHLKAAAPTPKG